MLNDPQYTPNRLLNYVSDYFKARNQAELCRCLNMSDAAISKIINRRQPVSSNLICAILDTIPEMTINQVRELAGMKK